MNSLSPLKLVLYGAGLYVFAYGLYWLAALMVGSPNGFRDLWAKALTLPGVALAALYFNKTNRPRGN